MSNLAVIYQILAKLGGGTVTWIRDNVDREEWLGALGLTCLGFGIGAIYWPAALIVVGLVCLYLAWEGARRGDSTRDAGSGS